MKNVKIYVREVAEKTGFRNFAYKPKTEIIVVVGSEKEEHLFNTEHHLKDKRIQIPFVLSFQSGSAKSLQDYLFNNWGTTLDHNRECIEFLASLCNPTPRKCPKRADKETKANITRANNAICGGKEND